MGMSTAHRSTSLSLFCPIVQRLCDMPTLHGLLPIEIRNRARDLEHSMITARRQRQPAGRRRQQLAILPNHTHMVPYDDPALFNDTVERFLRTPFKKKDRIADLMTSYEKLVAELAK
jgi:hypothetical protein